MAESAALLVSILPNQPIRQWVLSFPFQLHILFASYPLIMEKVLGIVYLYSKSSSVHYHFPTKTDLAVAVARRYTDKFMSALTGDQNELKTQKASLQLYISLFKQSLVNDNKMCLCGSLAAESANLPAAVQFEAKRFFDLNIQWLSQVFSLSEQLSSESQDARQQAIYFVSVLEGAMLTSQVTKDITMFDSVTKQLMKNI